jgi:hypothetical protein
MVEFGVEVGLQREQIPDLMSTFWFFFFKFGETRQPKILQDGQSTGGVMRLDNG